jgi:hypothetical protein
VSSVPGRNLGDLRSGNVSQGSMIDAISNLDTLKRQQKKLDTEYKVLSKKKRDGRGSLRDRANGVLKFGVAKV